MKKLTLTQTWTECLRMWRWIATKVRKGNSLDVEDLKEELDVEDLKEEWARAHGFELELENDCFFCDYDEEHKDDCTFCPGKKVDPEFDCRESDYHFSNKPIAFYNKLVALNRKRKAKQS